MPDPLRVIDFGRTSPLRSQTTWHAVAEGVSEGSPPTLSFVRPGGPYVSIGFHRRLDEVDVDFCREHGVPVYRRMVGGGPVYLDDGQLFFQITLPAASVPADRRRALRLLLEPAVEAFREVGVDARLDEELEIVVGDRKVCGHGAGQIGDAVVVVGNLIVRFDHAMAARVLRAPDAGTRDEVARLVRRFVRATPADPARFRDAAVRAYGQALGLEPRAGALSAAERARLVELDAQFADEAWVRGPDRTAPPVWKAKIRAGVWVVSATDGPSRTTLAVCGRHIARARICDPGLNGAAAELERALAGRRLADASSVAAALDATTASLDAALAAATAATRELSGVV